LANGNEGYCSDPYFVEYCEYVTKGTRNCYHSVLCSATAGC